VIEEIIVDTFAGGGGASDGISQALGREVDVAINHDEAAIRMHEANHPKTKHYIEDVWKAAPRMVTGGRPVGLLWASPDCKHFSRAKGGKPVSKNIRSLAWVVCRWAAEAQPRIIILENVREFADWGPLVPRWACADCPWKGTEGQAKLAQPRHRRRCPECESSRLSEEAGTLIPDPKRKGLTFRRFTGRLRNLGYEVDHKVLNAADYGAPTHRRRLFLVARRDGKAIRWPEPTHGDPKKLKDDMLGLKPYRTAAECIDWSLPCPSIFDRKKPLADATLRRIAHGIKRYVLDNPKPFIVPMTGPRAEEPMQTVRRRATS
jgi:DNA (cytosine-5)-methyltransferase 1